MAHSAAAFPLSKQGRAGAFDDSDCPDYGGIPFVPGINHISHCLS